MIDSSPSLRATLRAPRERDLAPTPTALLIPRFSLLPILLSRPGFLDFLGPESLLLEEESEDDVVGLEEVVSESLSGEDD